MVTNCAPMIVKLNPLLALCLPLRRADVGVIVHVGPLQKTTKVGIQVVSPETNHKAKPNGTWIPTFVGNLF